MLYLFLLLISTLFGLRVETPELLAPHQGSAFFPKASIDKSGNEFVVWQEFTKQGTHIFFSNRAPNNVWEPPICLSKGTFPQLQIDEIGHVFVIWQSSQGIAFCSRSIDGTWSPHEVIATPNMSCSLLKLVTNRRGDLAVMWKESGPIYSIFRPLNRSWTPPCLLTPEADTADLILDSSGHATAVWKDKQNTAKTADHQENWSEPKTLSDPGTQITEPQLVIDSEEQITALWITHLGCSSTIQASIRTNGIWSPPQILAAGLQKATKLTTSQNQKGNIVAAWMATCNQTGQVQAMMKDQVWGSPILLSSWGKQAQSPHAAIDESGFAIVTWLESDGKTHFTKMSTYTPSTKWSPPKWLTSGSHMISPQIVLSGKNILALWSQLNLGRYWIHTSQVFKE